MKQKSKAPKSVVDRMERLKKQPSPTAEEVDIQMKASIAVRKRLDSHPSSTEQSKSDSRTR